MKVLITGAAGRVGSVAANVLHNAGIELKLTDRKIRKDLPAKLEVLNLLDRDGVYRVLDGCDAVIHLGNHPHFHDGADAQAIYGENCQMNMNVFQAARELGVKKVVFISSVQVISGDRHYFEQEGKTPPTMLKYIPIDGDTPPNPRNPYSLSKLAGEKLCEFYLAPAGIEATAVRLPWTSHPEWWGYMKRRRTDKVRDHTLIDECMSYLHAEDAGTLMLAILRTSLPGFRVYQPAAKSLMYGLSVAEAVERFYAGAELRKPVSEMNCLVDISRITRETGWEPKFDASEPG